MARLDNWQNNLTALIEDKRHELFDFPTWNCLEWAAAAVKAVNGQDILKQYRGKYTSEKSAALLLRKIDDVKTSEELLCKYLGEAQPIGFARMGDIVLANPTDAELELPADVRLFGPVPGVCYGPISFFVGQHSLISVPTLSLGKSIWVS